MRNPTEIASVILLIFVIVMVISLLVLAIAYNAKEERDKRKKYQKYRTDIMQNGTFEEKQILLLQEQNARLKDLQERAGWATFWMMTHHDR